MPGRRPRLRPVDRSHESKDARPGRCPGRAFQLGQRLASEIVSGVPDLVGQALAIHAPLGLLRCVGRIVHAAIDRVADVAGLLSQLVPGVPDLVGQALVAVGLAPSFLGVRLAFAIGLLRGVQRGPPVVPLR